MLERRRLQQLHEHVAVIAGPRRGPPLRAGRVGAAR